MSSSTTQTTHNPNQLYLLTTRILNQNSLHFILISFLFLPLTFSASAAFKFYFSPSSSPTQFDPFNVLLIKTILASSQNLLTLNTITTILAFACFVILPTIAGIALITFSTNQAIHHKPLTFSSTLKSLSHSFTPLLYTIFVGAINIIILFLAFTLSSITVNKAVKVFSFHFILSVFINLIVSYALAFTIIFFITIWGSAAAITVLESKSGFQTLQQSANQSTKFRRHSFSIVYITAFVGGSALAYSTVLPVSGPLANWIMVLKLGAIYLQCSLVVLLYVVANTVLYVQLASGEEVVKTVVEGAVSGEYVWVAENDTDDGEVVHEVHEEEANGGFNYMFYLLTMVWVILFFAQLYYPPMTY